MGITEWFLELGVTLIEKGGYLGVLFALIVDSCGVPIPSEAVLALAGSVAKTGEFNYIAVIILGTVGQTLGACLAYGIGRYGGEPIIKRYGKYFLVSSHDYQKAHKWFEKRGDTAVFLSRLIPVIRTFSGFPAGTFEMNFKRFTRDTFAGSLVWSVIFTTIGYIVGDSWREYVKLLHWLDYLVIVAIVVIVGRYIYRKVKKYDRGN